MWQPISNNKSLNNMNCYVKSNTIISKKDFHHSSKIKVLHISIWMLHKILYILLHVISILIINYYIFKVMTLIESILLKNHVSGNFMQNFYISILFRQFTKSVYKTLNQFFTHLREKKICKFTCFI